MKKKASYTVIYSRAREGGYTAFFPAFPEVTVWYPTLRQCRKAAPDALKLHLEGLKELGERPHTEKRVLRESVRVEVG